jgi:hypothetical protein
VVTISPAALEKPIRFRWAYIALPVALFFLTVILAGSFYPFLSSDVVYHFIGDVPDRFLSRGGFIAWMIVPQLIFALIALAFVRLVMSLSRSFPAGTSPLQDLLPIMGNMWAVPQLVIVFTMVSFFLYNAYQIIPISLWILIVIVLGIGAAILALLFVRAIRRARRRQKQPAKNSQE